jgi:hypothetical protein
MEGTWPLPEAARVSAPRGPLPTQRPVTQEVSAFTGG